MDVSDASLDNKGIINDATGPSFIGGTNWVNEGTIQGPGNVTLGGSWTNAVGGQIISLHDLGATGSWTNDGTITSNNAGLFLDVAGTNNGTINLTNGGQVGLDAWGPTTASSTSPAAANCFSVGHSP